MADAGAFRRSADIDVLAERLWRAGCVLEVWTELRGTGSTVRPTDVVYWTECDGHRVQGLTLWHALVALAKELKHAE